MFRLKTEFSNVHPWLCLESPDLGEVRHFHPLWSGGPKHSLQLLLPWTALSGSPFSSWHFGSAPHLATNASAGFSCENILREQQVCWQKSTVLFHIHFPVFRFNTSNQPLLMLPKLGFCCCCLSWDLFYMKCVSMLVSWKEHYFFHVWNVLPFCGLNNLICFVL